MRYVCIGMTDFYETWYNDAELITASQVQGLLNFLIFNIQDGGGSLYLSDQFCIITMSRFFDFQDGGRSPSWIFKIEIFKDLQVLQRHVMHSNTKFCADRQYRCRDIAIFHIF